MSKVESHKLDHFGAKQPVKDSIDELNYRFREGGVGYEFANGETIRINSQFVHTEVVKRALRC